MKYTRAERLEIGRRVYDSELTRYEAAEEYGLNDSTVRSYMRMYRDINGLPAKGLFKSDRKDVAVPKEYAAEYAKYIKMTKEELIIELVKTKIIEKRLRKEYGVVEENSDKIDGDSMN